MLCIKRETTMRTKIYCALPRTHVCVKRREHNRKKSRKITKKWFDIQVGGHRQQVLARHHARVSRYLVPAQCAFGRIVIT